MTVGWAGRNKDVIFTSGNMAYGKHSVVISSSDKIEVDGVYVYSYGDKPVFSFSSETYDASKDDDSIEIMQGSEVP